MSSDIHFGPIADHVGFQVHLTWRAIRKRMLLRSRRAKPSIPRGAYSIPLLIGHNPGMSPRDLADALFLDQSKVALFLRQLETEGAVERRPSADDGRKIKLYLTARGQAHAAESLDKSEALEQPIAGVITAAERKQLVALLIKLQHGL